MLVSKVYKKQIDMEHKYEFKTYNGRIKVKIDGMCMFTFNQLDFKGYYAYKDDVNLYGLDIYLIASDSGGKHTIEIYFKTKETWLAVLKLLDENM
jgi:hypothetical protein